MKNLLIFIGTLTLVGCSTIKDFVTTKPTVVERPKLELPAIAPVYQRPITWTVLTKDNLEEKIKQLELEGQNVVFFALTPQGYQNLSINVAELRSYIQQQNAVIATLKEYYESPQTVETKK